MIGLTLDSRPLSTDSAPTKCPIPSVPSLFSRGLFSLFGWLRAGNSSSVVDCLLGFDCAPEPNGTSSSFAPRNTGGPDTGRALAGLGGLRSTAGASLGFLSTKYFSPCYCAEKKRIIFVKHFTKFWLNLKESNQTGWCLQIQN